MKNEKGRRAVLVTARLVLLLLLLLLLPVTVGQAQGPNLQDFKSALATRYTALTPNLLLTDTGVGTGGTVIRGGEGCNAIAAWAGDMGFAVRGIGGGGVTNVGY